MKKVKTTTTTKATGVSHKGLRESFALRASCKHIGAIFGPAWGATFGRFRAHLELSSGGLEASRRHVGNYLEPSWAIVCHLVVGTQVNIKKNNGAAFAVG